MAWKKREFPVLPEGVYDAICSDAVFNPTGDTFGARLELTFDLNTEDGWQSRKVFLTVPKEGIGSKCKAGRFLPVLLRCQFEDLFEAYDDEFAVAQACEKQRCQLVCKIERKEDGSEVNRFNDIMPPRSTKHTATAAPEPPRQMPKAEPASSQPPKHRTEDELSAAIQDAFPDDVPPPSDGDAPDLFADA